jgi:hypothetical protein
MICGNKNKPTLDGYWAQNGTEVVMDVELGPIVVRKAVWIEDHMSRECRFDQKTEEMCGGCERFNCEVTGA